MGTFYNYSGCLKTIRSQKMSKENINPINVCYNSIISRHPGLS